MLDCNRSVLVRNVAKRETAWKPIPLDYSDIADNHASGCEHFGEIGLICGIGQTTHVHSFHLKIPFCWEGLPGEVYSL
jgi:hypothetical protein